MIETLVPAIMIVAFLAGGLVMSRRLKAGWSPRRQQKLQRIMFYYAIGVLVLFMAGQSYSGQWQWTFFFFWGIFIASTAWQAFRKPSSSDLLKTFAVEPGLCSRCGYDLTGNTSGICPECGWAIPSPTAQVEKFGWPLWWHGWDIEYLEDWRKTLRSMIVLCVMFGGLAIWFATWPTVRLWIVLPVLMLLHFAINTARVISYGRRNGR